MPHKIIYPPTRYTGYLTPWLDTILTCGSHGQTYREIARNLWPIYEKAYGATHPDLTYYHYGPNYYSFEVNISSVLKLHGLPHTLGLGGPERYLNRRRQIWAMYKSGMIGTAIAIKLGISKARVYQILRVEREAIMRKALIEKHADNLDRVWEELTRPTTPGRPIDMGGPRDCWIEDLPHERRL